MIALLEMLATAALVSGAAGLCLKLLPHAPPRFRFRIALAALAAWAVPWPMLSLPFELPAPSIVVDWRDALSAGLPSYVGIADEAPLPAASASARPESAGPSAGSWSADGRAPALHANRAETAATAVLRGMQRWPFAYLVALLLLPGSLRLLGDAAALRASLAAWRESSRSGEALRATLPRELRDVHASIRIVPESAVAATSGWLRPVVWLGDRLCERDREVALVHELCHVQRKDPVWITFIMAMRRAYWWNPAVGWLCREAVLAMEADCDRRCACWFGLDLYTERLASMMLDAAAPRAPRLVAAARTPSLNVRRLKLLQGQRPRMRPRDYLLSGVMASTCAASAAYAVATPIASTHAVRTPVASVVIPETPAGEALEALLSAFNAGDSERLAARLGAFTPQELEFDVPGASEGLELIAVVANERLRIEYVAEDRANGTRHYGELEIDARDTTRITRLEVREAGARSGAR